MVVSLQISETRSRADCEGSPGGAKVSRVIWCPSARSAHRSPQFRSLCPLLAGNGKSSDRNRRFNPLATVCCCIMSVLLPSPHDKLSIQDALPLCILDKNRAP